MLHNISLQNPSNQIHQTKKQYKQQKPGRLLLFYKNYLADYYNIQSLYGYGCQHNKMILPSENYTSSLPPLLTIIPHQCLCNYNTCIPVMSKNISQFQYPQLNHQSNYVSQSYSQPTKTNLESLNCEIYNDILDTIPNSEILRKNIKSDTLDRNIITISDTDDSQSSCQKFNHKQTSDLIPGQDYSHHQLYSQPVQSKSRSLKFRKSRNSFQCNLCGKLSLLRYNLDQHIRTHTGEKPFKCPKCDKLFAQKPNLNRHIKIHSGEKPFECPECDKRFIDKVNLNAHVRIHTGEKPFKCCECERTFALKDTLRKHMRIHSGERPFKCLECGRLFSQKCILNVHMRIHSGEKPFKCPECDKKLTHRTSYDRHIRIHSGQKPFKCLECKKSFGDKSNLNRHMKIHLGTKAFKCFICNQEFTSNTSKKKHELSHSK